VDHCPSIWRPWPIGFNPGPDPSQALIGSCRRVQSHQGSLTAIPGAVTLAASGQDIGPRSGRGGGGRRRGRSRQGAPKESAKTQKHCALRNPWHRRRAHRVTTRPPRPDRRGTRPYEHGWVSVSPGSQRRPPRRDRGKDLPRRSWGHPAALMVWAEVVAKALPDRRWPQAGFRRRASIGHTPGRAQGRRARVSQAEPERSSTSPSSAAVVPGRPKSWPNADVWPVPLISSLMPLRCCPGGRHGPRGRPCAHRR